MNSLLWSVVVCYQSCSLTVWFHLLSLKITNTFLLKLQTDGSDRNRKCGGDRRGAQSLLGPKVKDIRWEWRWWRCFRGTVVGTASGLGSQLRSRPSALTLTPDQSGSGAASYLLFPPFPVRTQKTGNLIFSSLFFFSVLEVGQTPPPPPPPPPAALCSQSLSPVVGCGATAEFLFSGQLPPTSSSCLISASPQQWRLWVFILLHDSVVPLFDHAQSVPHSRLPLHLFLVSPHWAPFSFWHVSCILYQVLNTSSESWVESQVLNNVCVSMVRFKLPSNYTYSMISRCLELRAGDTFSMI